MVDRFRFCYFVYFSVGRKIFEDLLEFVFLVFIVVFYMYEFGSDVLRIFLCDFELVDIVIVLLFFLLMGI